MIAQAREAWRKRDGAALTRLTEQTQQQRHLLAPWVDYWRLFARLPAAQVAELEAFYQRWPGSYVEDRLRNDWLLELGRRQDWPAFGADYPRFRMDDDRDLHCQALRAERALGRPLKAGADALPLKERALSAWLAQRDPDEACHALARELLEAKVFGPEELRRKLNTSAETGRGKSFSQTLGLLGKPDALLLQAAYDNPARHLRLKPVRSGRWQQEAAAVALVRLAASGPDAAREHLEGRWAKALAPALAQWAWAQGGRQAALRQQPDAADWFRRALALPAPASEWNEDTLAWAARAALRAHNGAGDWELLRQVVQAMPDAQRQDPSWVYWHAQARYRSAAEGEAGEPSRHEARAALLKLAAPLHFYGQLAAEELGLRLPLPPAPPALSAAERQAAAQHPGLTRALRLIELGLRSEGVREWNFSLRGMGERELLAAAQRACDAQVWDRCINTSERTTQQIDLAQRYPMPFREQLVERARAAGLHPADPYGLIRQESRFIQDARSGVGASGLMQLMPATAQWTARKLGLAYHPQRINDMDLNLRLGMGYLRMVLDDFGGALPLAAAAYNAGPGRPRRWREGGELDAAAWAESIPFNETRDYVKKVLANATVYARLMGEPQAGLRERLGQRVGPRPVTAPTSNQDLP